MKLFLGPKDLGTTHGFGIFGKEDKKYSFYEKDEFGNMVNQADPVYTCFLGYAWDGEKRFIHFLWIEITLEKHD